MKTPKHIRDAIRSVGLELSDVSVESTGSNHYRLTLPNGRVIIMARTPSDYRASRNATAVLRKAIKP